ncbi:MAG: DUF3499 family protein [Actinomycetota bacterium]|nr:DUF3499 family protein [Actinomycetota bacterium]
MARRCARFGCGEPAVASTLFLNASSTIEIIGLADATSGIPLCSGHTRRLTAPIGWELVDHRTPNRVDPWAVEVIASAVADTAQL